MSGKKTATPDDMVPFGMTDYFKTSVLPLTVSGSSRTIYKEGPRTQNEDEFIMLVTGGTGTIYINHDVFHLKRGAIICMGPFHNYSIIPDPGSALELYDAHMNSGAYLYILSCPYLKVRRFLVPQTPAYAVFDEEETLRAQEVMQLLCAANKEHSYYNNKQSLLYMTELFGRRMRRSRAFNSPRSSAPAQPSKYAVRRAKEA